MCERLRWVIAAVFGVLSMVSTKAQTFNEWFRQNSTRLKYYARQIAELKLYLGQLQFGYAISELGLDSIGNGKAFEFDLHDSYYRSLDVVNPAVRGLPEVARIVNLQSSLIQLFKNSLTRYRRNGLLGIEEITYIQEVYSQCLTVGLSDMKVLASALVDGFWQMTDDERASKIHELYVDARTRHDWVIGLINRSDLLEMHLARDRADNNAVRRLCNIP